jgi:hypothetical protein
MSTFEDFRKPVLTHCVAAAATLAVYFTPSSNEYFSCTSIATILHNTCGHSFVPDYLKIVFGHSALRASLLRLIKDLWGEAELIIYKTNEDILKPPNVYAVAMTTGRRISYIVTPPANQSLFSNITAADDDEDDDAKLLSNFELAKARLYQDYVTARNTVFPISFSTPSRRSRTPSSGSSLDTQGIPHITPIGSLGSLDSSTPTATSPISVKVKQYIINSLLLPLSACLSPLASLCVFELDCVCHSVRTTTCNRLVWTITPL